MAKIIMFNILDKANNKIKILSLPFNGNIHKKILRLNKRKGHLLQFFKLKEEGKS